jgi:hypothetical protein
LQKGCKNPFFAQSVGNARSIRSELRKDFATCKVDDIDSSLNKTINVLKEFLHSRHDQGRRPDSEFVISGGVVVYTSRFNALSLSKEINPPVESTKERPALNLTIGKYGILGTL